LLGHAGVKTACIDQAPAVLPPGNDLRTTVISYGSRQILERAGVWENLAGDPAPIKNIEILDGHSPVLLNFMSEEVADKSFGWNIFNADLRAALMKTLAGMECVTHLTGTTVQNFEYLDAAFHVCSAVLGEGGLADKRVRKGTGRGAEKRADKGTDKGSPSAPTPIPASTSTSSASLPTEMHYVKCIMGGEGGTAAKETPKKDRNGDSTKGAGKTSDTTGGSNQDNIEHALLTRLVVGADGRGSFTRAWMGVGARRRDYKQRAIICTVRHENPHENIAVEHFWPQGPFAILPMADGPDGAYRSSVVFTEHGPERTSLMGYSDEAFEAALATRFPARYGQVELAGQRAAYPLGLVHASEYIAPRMVLIADAAHGIHPIAGQGLNLGFRDVGVLADLLAEAKAQGADPGGQNLLESYQRQRRIDNVAMIAMTDSLNRLFSNNIMPVRLLRKAGLRAVSKLPIAKRFFMRQAMGDR
jgi:2-polyprenyl-6-methoxyphenol hydroxylase-like FAD-dependent oxidoreductase